MCYLDRKLLLIKDAAEIAEKTMSFLKFQMDCLIQAIINSE